MKGKNLTYKLTASIIIALLASGAGSVAMADGTSVSERDALEQAVVLYEKMQNYEIGVPEQLIESGYDKNFVKSVILGFVNLDEYDSVTYSDYIRKQDFMNILYKTIISYNPDFAMDEAETERILNDCYDNAYLDGENRTAYAFMIKSGIIWDTVNSMPNSTLTWESCAILVEEVYNLFVSEQKINIEDTEIHIGRHISTVTDTLGMPNRIDESDYGFEWYVYDSNYENFVMIGVKGERICSFFTNCKNFSYNGIYSGEDFALLSDVSADYLTVWTDAYNKIDAIMYNPMGKDTNESAAARQAKGEALVDMINSYRVKNSIAVYSENSALSGEAFVYATGTEVENSDSTYYVENGYDIYEIYSNLLNAEHEILTRHSPVVKAIGTAVNADKTDESFVEAVFVTNDDTVAGLETKSFVTATDNTDTDIRYIKEVTTPVIVSPTLENTFEGNEDIIVKLAIRASHQYHIEVFDFEDDSYVVNKYVTTNDKEFTLPASLFEEGRDYKIIVSALGDDGTSLSSEPLIISYGANYNGINILAPGVDEVTENDYIGVKWESDAYTEFVVDLYDQDGNFLVNQGVEGEYEALIRGLEPGSYHLYITAMRRGTRIKKAQSYVPFTVSLPEPVINEIILDVDEVYDFVYEDEALGVLYFYDEDIIEVEEDGEIVKKKKIIQKQVKNTKGYRKLASYSDKRDKTTGDTSSSGAEYTETGNAIADEAKKYLGVPYMWGGETADGFDCSGLVQYVCNALGIEVDRVAEDQFKNGTPVNRDELIPGDLVFFESDGYIHHVGIYVGDNTMIHAPSTGDVVKYTSLDNEYFKKEYAGARRIY